MVAIIDYDAGNVASVKKACEALGREAILTSDEKTILSADHVILPGVGAFGSAMEKLKSTSLDSAIHKAIGSGIPFLGICLGLQLLFDESEESPGIKGLSVLQGNILRIPSDNSDKDALRVPNIGWNSLDPTPKGRLFEGIDDEPFVYFVHSYYLKASDRDVVTSTIDYGVSIDASVEKGNVFATQFHPEKSGKVGLKMLDNFLKI